MKYNQNLKKVKNHWSLLRRGWGKIGSFYHLAAGLVMVLYKAVRIRVNSVWILGNNVKNSIFAKQKVHLFTGIQNFPQIFAQKEKFSRSGAIFKVKK
jgi:hypothetical protein